MLIFLEIFLICLVMDDYDAILYIFHGTVREIKKKRKLLSQLMRKSNKNILLHFFYAQLCVVKGEMAVNILLLLVAGCYYVLTLQWLFHARK